MSEDTTPQANGYPGAPERIYLQVCDDPDCGDTFAWHRQMGEVCWCEDRINDSDIEYVRADRMAEPPPEVLAALDRMCQPLHESRLSGATAAADARCMSLIRDYVLRKAAERPKGAGDTHA